MDCDFTTSDKLVPHPVYAWICVLNPSEQSFQKLKPYIQEDYAYAKEKFKKRRKQLRHVKQTVAIAYLFCYNLPIHQQSLLNHYTIDCPTISKAYKEDEPWKWKLTSEHGRNRIFPP